MNTVAAESSGTIDPRIFRDTLGQFPTGVVIITAMVEGQPIGMVVGSFASVSLEPPLVAFFPTRSSSTYAKLKQASTYCVNVLSVEQESICRKFASKSADKFADVDWHMSPHGLPRLTEAAAWIEFKHTSTTAAGDSDVVLGEVFDLKVNTLSNPLLFFQGGYGGFRSRSRVAPFASDLREQLQVADIARDIMEDLSDDLHLECFAQAIVDGDIAIVAGAGGTPSARAQIGRRLPLVPPYGAVFLAGQPSDEAVTSWSTNLKVSDTHHKLYVQMLDRVAERGWSLGLSAPDHDAVWTEVATLSEAPPTPAIERELINKLERLLPYYEPEEIRAEAQYDARLLVAPVHHGGKVVFALALFNLPQGVAGEELLAWAERLTEAAAQITERLEEQ